ncbi:FHA domain-containing protein [Candidatus Binatus sp.]|uniref:FHA domain-containing protein n=1 Tax=Candidatus Binatus sp. TaxID=2811406 RepID=UPI003BB10ABA
MIKCSECGYENMDGLDYCDGCGAKLAAAAGSSAAAAPGAAPATETKTETPPEPTAESIDGKATPSLAADAMPDGETPTTEMPKSEAPTGEIKPETAPESAPSTAAAAGAPFKAKLSVVRGGRKGQEFPLEDGNNLVGRWDPETGSFPEVDLDADDPEAKISRKHALIRIDAGKITIEDIGSLNGTYVNRQPRLSPGSPAEIKSGDEVIIGKTFLKLVVEPIS